MADGVTFKVTASSKGRIAIDDKAIALIEQRLNEAVRSRKRCARDVINKYALLVQSDSRRNLRGVEASEEDPTIVEVPSRIDEGTLRRSIQILVSTVFAAKVSGFVFTELEYAPFVHWGTGIYGEDPKGGHRLTPWVYFDEKRQQFFYTRGMAPNKFMLNAYLKHHENFMRDIEKCLAGGK